MATALTIVNTTSTLEPMTEEIKRTGSHMIFNKTGQIDHTIFYSFNYGTHWKQWELWKRIV